MQSWCAVLLILMACKNTNEEQPAPRPPRDAAVLADAEVVIPVPRDAAPAPYRRVLDEMPHPMNMVVLGPDVYWTDSRGNLYVKSWQVGAAPTRRIDTGGQRVMFLGVHGGKVLTTIDNDVAEVQLQGPPKPLGLQLPDSVLQMASGGGSLYVTIYRKPQVFEIVGVKPVPVLPGYAVAVHGDHVYASSYGGGTLVTRPLAGGAMRTIATKLPKPTGLAVDATHAFVWCETDRTLRRIDLKSGAMTTIKSGTNNSDSIVSDGDWIYLGSWGQPAELLRVAKDGTATQIIANDLHVPYDIAVDETGVFVTDRDAGQLIRFEKAQIQ